MQIEIYEDSPPVVEEPKLRLKLVQDFEQVWLVAVDENGFTLGRGHLLSITEEGFGLQQGVGLECGLPLTVNGHVVLRGNLP